MLENIDSASPALTGIVTPLMACFATPRNVSTG